MIDRLTTGRLLRLLPAAAVLLFGLVLLVGGLRGGVGAGGAGTTTATSGPVTGPVAVTAPGLLELVGTSTELRTSGDGTSFIGVGRAEDVEAYLGPVARTTLTALELPGTVRTSVTKGEATLPAPETVDIWASAARGTGEVRLRWPATPGRWTAVVAVDGARAPGVVRMTWAGGTSGGADVPRLVIGLLLTLAAVALIARTVLGPDLPVREVLSGLLPALRRPGGRRAVTSTQGGGARPAPAPPGAPTAAGDLPDVAPGLGGDPAGPADGTGRFTPPWEREDTPFGQRLGSAGWHPGDVASDKGTTPDHDADPMDPMDPIDPIDPADPARRRQGS